MKKVKKISWSFDAKKLASDIFAKRSKENLSFVSVGELTGTSKAFIFQLEGLHNADIKISMLPKVCDWLGTKPADYFVSK